MHPAIDGKDLPRSYDASSDARKQTAAAMSSGVPRRRRGTFDAHSSRALPVIARVMSVSMSPGAITLAVIPREATSSATALVNPMRPAFDAA